jgi:hypothetical protein
MRESAESWRELLLDLKRRGLSVAPELAGRQRCARPEKLILGPAAQAVLIGLVMPAAAAATTNSAAAPTMKRFMLLSLAPGRRTSAGLAQSHRPSP